MYIQSKPNEIGAYPPPQNTKAAGLLFFSDELLDEFIKYSGFVVLEVEGDTVIGITPNTEAWEAWNLAEDEKQHEAEGSTEEGADIWDELDKAYCEGVNSAYDE